MKTLFRVFAFSLSFIITGQSLSSQNPVTSPKEHFGINIGENYNLITYSQMIKYWKILAEESPRMILEDIGVTAEGRVQTMAIITSPENHKNLLKYKNISAKLAHAKDLTVEEADKLAIEGKAVVWIDGGLHATEVVGSHQLMELVYQMISKSNAETLRWLDDIILLAVPANPDGLELVSSWYMRNEDQLKRSTGNLPRLYQKYVGHDNNRDSYMATQPETVNMARIMYREWFPQVMYNHHQTGPSDIIVFVPPFRDPPNYWFDPILITGIQSVGLAMHSRLVAEGMPGSGMRSRANYSTWFNGNLRTTGYFHNQIGILTEIKGNPTPLDLSFFPDRQLPSNDMPFPHKPRTFYFREAIDYSITMDQAILDYASRNKETLLKNRFLMGKNHIDKGSRDNWTIHPDIVDMVVEEARKDEANANVLNPTFRRRGRGVDIKYYDLFNKPENRDPRGYILPSDQPDFATATQFVNTFIKNGITVHKATADFEVNGKSYPEGSYVFKTAQAFRSHVMDLFEPQDHPDDFLYPGGPPVPPYDNAGYTLAFQMGVEFDRILDSFDGPFEEIKDIDKPKPGTVTGANDISGYLLSHATNNSAIAVNRLLIDKHKVYWLKEEMLIDGKTFPVGTIYIESKRGSKEIVPQLAFELGIDFYGINSAPQGDALKVNPVRIGLWDRYGGSMPSGWTRWLMEQFEFKFDLVFPQELDKGDLNSKFDVLVFVTGAIPSGERRTLSAYQGSRRADPETIPAEYREWLGSVTSDRTIPELMKFINRGGTIIALGSSTSIAGHAGLPVKNHIVDKDGNQLSSEEYYIPSSILNVRIDNTLPIAYGMKERTDIFFSNSPVFRFEPDAIKSGVTPIAWFDSDRPLRSGWAWGQDRLYGGVAMAEASLGKGKLYLFGPEVLFRAQSHGTFKLFFNGIYLSNADEMTFK